MPERIHWIKVWSWTLYTQFASATVINYLQFYLPGQVLTQWLMKSLMVFQRLVSFCCGCTSDWHLNNLHNLEMSVDIVNKLELQYAVVLFAEALYAKAQQVRWTSDEFFNKFIFWLGKFHACMSDPTAISCPFRSAGSQVSIFNILFQYSCISFHSSYKYYA